MSNFERKGVGFGFVERRGSAILPLLCFFRFFHSAFGFRIISGRVFGLVSEYIYLIKINKSDLKIKKKILMWKIVERSKALVLYIYIYIYILMILSHN